MEKYYLCTSLYWITREEVDLNYRIPYHNYLFEMHSSIQTWVLISLIMFNFK